MEQLIDTKPSKNDILAFLMDEESDIDIENVEFKVLNKGLGFHQKEAERIYHPARNRSKDEASRKKTELRKTALTDLGISNPENTEKINEISLKSTELSAFYKDDVVKEQPLRSVKKVTKKKLKAVMQKEASIFVGLAAWIIDMILVMSLVGITAGLFVFLSGYSVQQFQAKLSNLDLIIYFGSIFIIYYLSYFSILDILQSPGKAGLKVSLVKTNGERAGINETFTRSVVTLLSIPLLGLPCLIDFQGKLSDTKLIENV